MFAESGGNPFYLQQLAPLPRRAHGVRGARRGAGGARRRRPPACCRAPRWPATRSSRTSPRRRPAMPEPAALDALDDLLAPRPRAPDRRAAPLPLPPPARAQRRLRVVARRLAARPRTSAAPRRWPRAALRRRRARTTSSTPRATATRRRSRVLREAGETVMQRTPAGAARWFGAALRLLPDATPPEERMRLLMAYAGALAAAARFAGRAGGAGGMRTARAAGGAAGCAPSSSSAPRAGRRADGPPRPRTGPARDRGRAASTAVAEPEAVALLAAARGQRGLPPVLRRRRARRPSAPTDFAQQLGQPALLAGDRRDAAPSPRRSPAAPRRPPRIAPRRCSCSTR